MALCLPDTQTPDILSLTPTMRSNVIEMGKPWGRLYSTYVYLEAVDLEKKTFKLGRAEDCDVIITKDKVPINRITNISKLHFVITKEDNLIYITDLSKNGTFINGELIGKGNRNILQNDDEIAISFKALKVYVFKVLGIDDNNYLPLKLRQKYQISRTLGVGACGEVKLVFDKVTCRPYAVKKIVKGRNSQSAQYQLNHPEKIKSEIKILQSLNHPCVIAMKEIVETEENVFMILEYMEGGELNEIIQTAQKPLTEDQVKFLFYQMVLAVQYLHNQDITHRDLKPENVLLKERTEETLIKISDFGLSKILVNENDMMKTVCGTPNYVAPEVLDKKVNCYTKQVDVWSLGVILFYMIGQELPFVSKDRTILNRKILIGFYNFNPSVWAGVTEECKDLVRRMLTVDPVKRITIDEIIKHKWIQQDFVMKSRVENLLYSQRSTDCVPESESEGSDYSPCAKRSKLSDSF